MTWEEWSLSRLERKTLRCVHHKGEFCIPLRSSTECTDCYEKETNAVS